ncbi:hypothetical protein F4780DRAFT_785687 [Xylariomycetidae sp. FL0641]|nr:hypothetical protein F4780DRAFT_785687 [Xylariomycetidae sp. FL0641]
MCVRRQLHLSVHDVRSLMTLAPFGAGLDGVFVDPVTPAGRRRHACGVQLPAGREEEEEEDVVDGGGGARTTLRACAAHACCRVWRIDVRCGGGGGVCPLFAVVHEYVPYARVMTRRPTTDTDTDTEPPMTMMMMMTWDAADLPAFPEAFCGGRPFPPGAGDADAGDGAAIRDLRRRFFRRGAELLARRRALARAVDGHWRDLHALDITLPGLRDLPAQYVSERLDGILETLAMVKQMVLSLREACALAEGLRGQLARFGSETASPAPSPDGPLLEDLQNIAE